ncbi:MAG: hypothetical protein Q9208_005471 [Pyrenodesmia sp. 3 TL-2023]
MDITKDQLGRDAFGDYPVGSIVHKVHYRTNKTGDQKDLDALGDSPLGRMGATVENNGYTQSAGRIRTYVYNPSTEEAEDYVYLQSSGKTAPNGKPSGKTDDDDCLPDGWEKRKTPGGKRYYVNHNDFTTQWSRPDSGSDYDMVEDFTQSEPLPEGWVRKFDQVKPPYYVNQETRTSTWQHPTSKADEEIGSLPQGWEQRRTHRQQIYYVDHNTRTTTWRHPNTADDDDGTRPLPEGWTRRRSRDSERFYYVDRDYNKTSYFFPQSRHA